MPPGPEERRRRRGTSRFCVDLLEGRGVDGLWHVTCMGEGVGPGAAIRHVMLPAHRSEQASPEFSMQTAQATRLFERAVIALRVGSRTAARRVLGRLVADRPSQAAPWIALAHAAGSPLVAIDCLEKALALEADSAVARAGLEWHRWLLEQAGSSPAPNQPVPSNAAESATDRPETVDAAEPRVRLSRPVDEQAEATTLVADDTDDTTDAAVEKAAAADERGRSMLRQIDELEASLNSDLAPAAPLSMLPVAGKEMPQDVVWAPDAVTNPKVLPELVDEADVVRNDPTQEPVASTLPEARMTSLPPAVDAPVVVDVPTPVAVAQVVEPVVETIAELPTSIVVAASDVEPMESAAIEAVAPVALDVEAMTEVATNDQSTAEETSAEAATGFRPITEQELATTEWRRWVTGAAAPTGDEASRERTEGEPARATAPSAESARLVNEVSERLALALQRVLGQRADELVTKSGLSTTTVATTDVDPVSPPVVESKPSSLSDSTLEDAPGRGLSSLPVPEADAPRILVVDDSATIRRVVVDGLTRHGYHVFEAGDGVEGIREIATRKPDLILLDITMPRLDGYRLCRLVKGHASTRHIPVVMLSGKDGTFDRLRGRLAGCSDYITKPFDSESLLAKVEQHLKVKAVKS
jgi:twitching motility two-component system response regulator PilG